MVEPYSIQDMAREAVYLMHKKLADLPAESAWRIQDLTILRSAIEDERFRDLLNWKIQEAKS